MRITKQIRLLSRTILVSLGHFLKYISLVWVSNIIFGCFAILNWFIFTSLLWFSLFFNIQGQFGSFVLL